MTFFPLNNLLFSKRYALTEAKYSHSVPHYIGKSPLVVYYGKRVKENIFNNKISLKDAETYPTSLGDNALYAKFYTNCLNTYILLCFLDMKMHTYIHS